MKPHISERLRFVEVEDKGRKELIWWPSLIFSSFTEMLPSFPSRLMRARAVVDRENSRPLPNSNWVYLLGKSRLNNNKQFFTSIRPDETEIRVKDFFIALEEMENKYHNDQDWNLAKKEGVALLSQWVNSTVIEFPDSEGGTFTYFNMDNQDEIQVLNTTSSSLNNVENNSKSDKKDVPVSNSENDNTDDHYDHLTSVLSAHQEDEVEQLDDHRNKKRKHASESEIESSCMHNESKLAKKAKRKSKEEKKSSTDSRESSKVQKSASTDLEREDPVSKKSYLESMLETSDHQTETEALQNNSTEHSSSPERKSTRLESPTSPPATQTTQSQTSLSFKVTPQNKTDQTKKQRKLSSISSPHSKRKRQISQRECWKYVMQILREDHGFFRVLGSGMVDEYWVTSEHSQKSVDEKFLCANLENGKDYFIGEAGLKAYVHNRYNWIGEPGREFTPFSDKRRRRRISDSKLDKKPMTMPKRKKSSIKKISTKEKGTHRVIARTDCWKLVCKILQEDYGFFRVYGSGLITNYWVSGKYSQQDITEKYLQNHLQENKDYFIGDEGLKGFAHSEHKWIGELGREFSPISHKRTRRRIQDTEVEKEKSPVKSEKASKVDKGHRSTTKKSAKKSAKKPRSKISVGSSRSPEDSTGSKWSGSNYSNESKRTSVKKNPSISSSNSQKFPPNEVSFCSKSTRTRTVEERLEDCLKRLNMSYIAKDSLFDGSGSNSSFSEKKESIVKFLEMSMSGESNKASLMHVCGNPGLGKTTLVRYCVEAAVKNEKKNDALFLSAADLPADAIISEIANKLGVGKGKSVDRDKVEKALKASSGKNAGGYLFLVLDEVDFLLKNCGNNKKINKESALSCVLEWAVNPSCRLAIIGISNSVGNTEARLLKRSFKDCEDLIFGSYTESDLTGIVLKRLGRDKALVADAAIQYASKKVAKQSGDVRKLLELFTNSFMECKGSLSRDQLISTVVDKPIVAPKHVVKAVKNSGLKSQADIIKSLPQKQKTVLCIASALNQVSDAWRDIPLSTLRDYSIEAAEHGVMDGLTTEVFNEIILALEDSGLLCTGGVQEFNSSCEYDDPANKMIRVGAQLEEVEFAIQETLMENSFYKRLVEHVRQTDIHDL